MWSRIFYLAGTLFPNPRIFFKKTLGRVLVEVLPSPKGCVPIIVGGHAIDTWPSQNTWWKSLYVGYCDSEIA